ncbi:N-formylglutamate amidohydrolase [Sphingomonas sp. CGMCC 1.13654]|uniref:N-formylglutamate amidohydrolase n=1 Tax=Sphingomonas chungangi TaxID=2683589 RepID=A0A838L909_9SPHN|nr:N-formylglutamate amidohydrolase [Sphingomonas chungangi]MBA2935933.1 N-formylglutamate amidohydrolase [Sphingomonas chungangi]MVW54624.1 N-formylglutamate amidohydrolase [Sphingomonas chungangi]
MPDERSTHPSEIRRLLGDGDPSPVTVINPEGHSPFLLIGDHAGNAIPTVLGTMGLTEDDRHRHIAWDIGTAQLGDELARMLDATFIHQHYSRLVIDCNRAPDRADAFPETSDGSTISGNAGLTAEDRARRIGEIHEPYQRAIADAIEAKGRDTILVSLHSFTPRMDGVDRPWHIGVLHDGANDRFALAMLRTLEARQHLIVGDNEPYVMDDTDYTVPRHAFSRSMPYVELEVSQSELARNGGVARWSQVLTECLRACQSA